MNKIISLYYRCGYLIPLAASAYVPSMGGHPMHSLVVITALVWSLLILVREKKPCINGFLLIGGIYVLWTFLGLLYSLDKNHTCHELTLLITGFSYCLALQKHFTNNPAEKNRLIVFIVLLSLWKTAESLISPDGFVFGTGQWHTLPNPHVLGVLMVTGTLLIHKDLATQNLKIRTIKPYILILFSGLVLWISWRLNLYGTFLGLVIGHSIIFTFGSKTKKLRLIPLFLGLFLLLMAVWPSAPAWLQNNPRDPAKHERLTIWKNSIDYFLDHPVIGTGLGTYAQHYEQYQTLPGHRVVRYAHNEYIQIVCETGVAGGILAIAFLFVILKRIWQKAEESPGIFASILILIIWACFDFVFRADAPILIFSGLLAYLTAGKDMDQKEKTIVRWQNLARISLFSLITTTVLFSVMHGTSLVLHAIGKKHLNQNKPKQALPCFKKGFAINPLDAHLLYDQAVCLKELNRQPEAARKLQKALCLEPRDFWVRRKLAILHISLHGNETAINTYKPILKLAPSKPQFFKEIGDLYEWTGNKALAQKHYNKAAWLMKTKF